MKKYTYKILIAYLLLFTLNNYGQVTVRNASTVTFDQNFQLDVNRSGYPQYGTITMVIKDNLDKVLYSGSYSVNDLYNITCSSVTPGATSLSFNASGRLYDYCPSPEGNTVEECNASNINANGSANLISLGNSVQPTNITQIQSAICSDGNDTNLQFQTSNTYLSYKWYKNNTFISETSTQQSPLIPMGSGDKIGLVGKEACKGDSSILEMSVNVAPTATLNLNPVNTNACFNGNYIVNTTTTNSNSIEWFTNSSLTDAVPGSWITGSNGSQITIPANFTGSKIYYARSINSDNCNSNVETVTLNSYDNPNVTSITGENESTCSSTINLKVNGTNIASVKWFNGIEGLNSQIISTNNAFSYNITNLSNGTNSVFYIAETSNGCKSAITKVDFTKLASGGNVSTVSETEYCKNDAVNILLSSSTSVSYQWFEDSSMNIPAPTSHLQNNGETFSYTANTIGRKTWYYRGVSATGCYTPLYDIDIDINNAPENLTITNIGASFCTNTVASFEASANGASSYAFYKNSGGTLPWGSSNVSGNKLSINGSELNIGQNAFWYKAINSSGCETDIKEVSFTINQAPSQPLRSNGNLTYCLGEQVQITIFSSSASSGYQWSYTSDFNNLIESSKIGNSEASLLQYTPNTTGTTTYYYRSVANGCFSENNSLDVIINPQVGVVTVNNNGVSFCQNDTVELIAGATNSSGGFEWFTDAAGTIPASGITGTNDNTFRLVTDTNTPTGTTTLWVRGINSSNCNSPLKEVTYNLKTTPSNLQISGDTDYCTGDIVSLVPSANNGTSYQWALDSNFNNLVEASKVNSSGVLAYTATTTENTNYYYRALNSSGCESEVKSITVEVLKGATNLAITNNGIEVCQNESIQFVATADDATSYRFFNHNGAQIGSSNSLIVDTSVLQPNTYNYKVQAFNSNGCDSNQLSFSFVVKPNPNTPTISGTQTYCVGETLSLTATSTGSTLFKWFSDAALNTEITSNLSGTEKQTLSFVTTTSQTKTYYVVANNSVNCSSEKQQITVTINPQVGVVTVNNNGASFCQNETVELIAGATNADGGFLWFIDAAGTIPASGITGTKDNTFRLVTDTNTPTGTTTLWVYGINSSNCNSELKEVTYTVKTTPSNLQVFGDTDYCTGDIVSLVPSANNGTSYQWALDSNFINLVETSKINSNGVLAYEATTLENTTYFYRALNTSGCESEINTVTVKVLKKATNIAVTNNGIAVCQGENIIFLATADDATSYKFFNENGSEIGASNSLYVNTTSLQPNTYSYKIQALNSSGCNSELFDFSFTVYDVPNTPTVTGDTVYCNGTEINLTATSAGSTFIRWYSDPLFNNPITTNISGTKGEKLSFTSTEIGVINYYIVAENSNNCTSTTQEITVTINQQVGDLTITNDGVSFCQNDTVELIARKTNTDDGFLWFTDQAGTTPASGITGSNDNTFSLVTDINTPIGTTSLWVRGTNSSNCNSSLKEVTYIIEPKPINLQIEGNTIICLGETVKLSVKANFTDNFLWFHDINEINPINTTWLTALNGSEVEFTPTNLGVQRLYYKAINNAGCRSSLNMVEINVNQKPTQLDITNNNGVFCSNEIANFEASAFNVDHFEWWKNSDLNRPLEVEHTTGASKNKFTIDTSILGEGEYIYYVVGVNSSGCKTTPLLLNFTINPIPLTPSVSGEPFVCIGENLQMTVISDGATSYKWYYDNEKNFPINPLYVIGNGSSISIPATIEQQGTIYVEGINVNDCTTELINFNYRFNKAPLNLNVTPFTQTVCIGSEIKIEAGADNATEFLWWKDSNGTIPLEEEKINNSSNNTVQFISNSSNIGITSYYVQAKNVSGCTTTLEKVEFEVLALPEIVEFISSSTDFQFLYGDKIIFNFNAENYTKHRILKDGIPIKNWTNGTIYSFILTSSANGDENGVYTLETSNGYCNTSENITIYVFDLPLEILHDKNDQIVNVNGFEMLKIIQGQLILFTSNIISDNYTFEWNFGDGFFNTEKVSSHYYNIAGTYTVILTLTNNITNAKRLLELTTKILVEPSDNEIDINTFEALEESEISFAPNPFKNKLSLKVNNLERNTQITIRIFNLSGINAFVETFAAYSGDNIFTWNNPLGGSPRGVYVVRLKIGEELKTFKLIKEQ